MKRQRLLSFGRLASRSHRSRRHPPQARRARFERLEDRWVLSPTIAAIPNQVVAAGSPYLIALNGGNATGITYTVTSSNSSMFSAVINPESGTGHTNNSLSISVSHTSSGSGDPAFSGTMTFQLFGNSAPNTVSRISGLASDNGYSGDTFYRIAQNSSTDIFAIQGGSNKGVGSYTAEITSTMEFTTSGILAIANAGGTTTDGNDFFITTEPTPWLDNGYTIFGMQTGGENVRQEIAGVATTVPSQGDGVPIEPVNITSTSVSTDPLDGVLLLTVSPSATGTGTITVTATDTQGNQTTESFEVTTGPPILTTIPDISVPGNTGSASYTGYTFDMSATAESGDTLSYSAVLDASSPLNSQSVAVSSTSAGAVTILPAQGVAGVAVMDATVTDTTNDTTDSQQVAVLIDPLAPGSVTFQAPAGSTGGFTNLDNSSPAKELTFQVTGLLSGAEVSLLANGSVFYTGTAPANGTVTTDGTHTLSPGSYTITAEQTLPQQEVPITGHSGVSLVSPASSASAQITVDTTAPSVSSVTPSTPDVTVANVVNSQPLTLAVLFSEAMNTAVAPTISFPTSGKDPTLAPASLTFSSGSWSADGKTYTATYNVTNQGVDMPSIDVEVAGAQDPAGNLLSASTTSGVFSIDTVDPAVLSLTPNLTTLAAANTGSGAFTLTVVYSEAMDTSVNPTILFPTSGKDPTAGGTLTFSSGTWTNSTTYVASYNVANKGLAMSSIDVEVEDAMDSSATHTQAPYTQSGVFSINMPTSTLSGLVTLGSSKLGINGVTVRLLENGQDVAGSPTQTGLDGSPAGSYSFTTLSAGTYEIEVIESPDYAPNWTATAGSLGGTTTVADQIQVTLGSGQSGTGYDFTAPDILSKMISARLWLASSPPLIQMVQSMHTPPTVSLSGSSATASTATYEAGGSAVAVAPSATISSPGSTTLAWLTATITNPSDGTSESLVVPTTATAGTNITSTPSGDGIKLSGVADLATYETVLQSLTYSDAASPPQGGNRSITVVANDGTASSTAVTATVKIEPILLSPATLPPATVNVAYNQTIAASGGTGTTTLAVTNVSNNTLGLSVPTSGTGSLAITGTPTATGTETFTVTATDTASNTSTTNYSITVNPVGLSPATLPAGTVNTAYNQTITAVGGTGTVSLAVSNIANAVAGLSVPTSGTGSLAIAGTPTATGTETFSVTATDAANNTATFPYSITVNSVAADSVLSQTDNWLQS